MKQRTRLVLISVSAALGGFALFLGYQFLYPGNPSRIEAPAERYIVAHRGVHQNYEPGTYDLATGCEAEHIYPPKHRYIENTIASIGAAFDAGATMVEIDIRRTADDDLVIFHDFRLDCRTDGEGLIREHVVAYLKTLDIGFGYTPDGVSYPLRGLGTGKIPTLREVLAAFPSGDFLIDHKDGDIESTQILLEILRELPSQRIAHLWYWGPEERLELIQSEFPEIRRFFMLRWQAKKAMVPFMFTFGMIGVPDEYRGLFFALPMNYRRYIWGWPYRFIRKLRKEGTPLLLYIDTAEDAIELGDLPVDGFVTEYIEITGPILSGIETRSGESEVQNQP